MCAISVGTAEPTQGRKKAIFDANFFGLSSICSFLCGVQIFLVSYLERNLFGGVMFI